MKKISLRFPQPPPTDSGGPAETVAGSLSPIQELLNTTLNTNHRLGESKVVALFSKVWWGPYDSTGEHCMFAYKLLKS